MVPKSTKKFHAHKDNVGERYKFIVDDSSLPTLSLLGTCTSTTCDEEEKVIPRATKVCHMSSASLTRRSRKPTNIIEDEDLDGEII